VAIPKSVLPSGQGWLSIWVIFKSPGDFPGEFVVREQRVVGGVIYFARAIHARGATVEEVRETLPAGVVRMERHPNDDPNILETWM